MTDKKEDKDLGGIFANLDLGQMNKNLIKAENLNSYNLEEKANNTDTSFTNKKVDPFKNISIQPSNVSSVNDETVEYPSMEGLVPPCHLNNPERTVGNGRGSAYGNKTIIKDASFLKRAFSMYSNSSNDLNELISAVMGDSQLSFDQKNQIISALKSQPPSVISKIRNSLGMLIGSGIGLAIAKFLFGSGFGGQAFGTLLGGYIGNNLQNRWTNNSSPINRNPFSSGYNPGFINNPF